MIFNKFLKYHFILTTGQEVFGRVLAWDENKIVVSTAEGPAPFNRVMIFKQAIAMTEPVAELPAKAG